MGMFFIKLSVIQVEIIRIFHGCEVWIEKSLQESLFGRHHKALPSDAKRLSQGTDFSVRTKQPLGIIFLAYPSFNNYLNF